MRVYGEPKEVNAAEDYVEEDGEDRYHQAHALKEVAVLGFILRRRVKRRVSLTVLNALQLVASLLAVSPPLP